MRIIGGSAKGRRLQTPSKSPAKNSGPQVIRPTADRAREALFSIIGHEVRNALILDLFAGAGTLGLEALSRSAGKAIFIDNSHEAISLLRKNIDLCGFSDKALVLKRDLSKGFYFFKKLYPGEKANITFIDPPYGKGLSLSTLEKLEKADVVTVGGLVVAEENILNDLPEQIGELKLVDRRRYGDTGFWLYRRLGAAL